MTLKGFGKYLQVKIKRYFCLHLRWKPFYGWHPARRFGSHIWECKECGKVIAREPWNPPIDYEL